MSERTELDIRLDLARGHWTLGDHDDALFCLERCAEREPMNAELRKLAESFLDDLRANSGQELLEKRVEELLSGLSPAPSDGPAADADPLASPSLASATLAGLLAEQGHTGRALEVVEDVLRRDPGDERARAVERNLQTRERERDDAVIEELERWLANARRRVTELEALS